MAHGLLQLILLCGEHWADIFNTAMTLILSWLICEVSGKRGFPYFFAAMGMLLGLNANWRMSMVWESGAANYLYMAGWLMWVPAIILMVIVVVNIVKDKYIVNKYLSRRKILLSTECIICCITIVYVIFNVIYNSYLLRNGGGQYTEGVYYLINMGERIREITKEDYGRLLLAEYRLFTGHILLLYALEVLFFRIKRMEEE